MAKFLTKELILKGECLKVKKHIIDKESGDFVYIKTLSADAFSDFRERLEGIDKKDEEAAGKEILENDIYLDLVVECLCDEKGKLLFSEEDKPGLKKSFSLGDLINIFKASASVDADLADPKN